MKTSVLSDHHEDRLDVRIHAWCPNGCNRPENETWSMQILDSEHHATGRFLAVLECSDCKERIHATIEIGTGIQGED